MCLVHKYTRQKTHCFRYSLSKVFSFLFELMVFSPSRNTHNMQRKIEPLYFERFNPIPHITIHTKQQTMQYLCYLASRSIKRFLFLRFPTKACHMSHKQHIAKFWHALSTRSPMVLIALVPI